MDDDITIMGKLTRKGKLNGSYVLDALVMLGTIVLNVVHVVQG